MSNLSLTQHAILAKLWDLNYKEVQEVLDVLEEQHAEQPAYCGECGHPCSPFEEDFGLGKVEFWGQISIDKDMRIVSDCCAADVFTNWELTVNFGRWDLSPEEY